MREKRALDKVTILSFKKSKFEINIKSDEINKVEKFNKKALKCPNSYWKKEEAKVKIFWCSLINRGCHITRCPLLKINKSL